MKTYFVIIALITLSIGCATHYEDLTLNLNESEELICQQLRDEIIPFPQTTPYDGDVRKREAYLTGFCRAWNYVVTGNFLHATAGFSTPDDVKEPWNVGWKDGYKIAGDRWNVEYEKLRHAKVR